MSNCQFAGGWPDPPYTIYHDFKPQSAGDTVGFFSTGEHTITAFVSTQDAYSVCLECDPPDPQESWITIILDIEYTEPCVVGSLFSDALVILPLAVLAGTLMVLRKRK